ncbi:hypothetical protein Syun_029336 [Stephania yunnanensis]|uniref:Uncharacterized protein n=1 Tax=Stephania yunnanensis TaxID=152371 RepID=A0AAP0E9R4_9MAGN
MSLSAAAPFDAYWKCRCWMKYLREMWRLGTLTYRILCLMGRGGDAFGAFEEKYKSTKSP